jgi:type II secretory pathway pseudopilin PulG
VKTPPGSARGFTLVELMIAGIVSSIVVLGAFAALTSVQRSAARQQEADEVVGAARIAMEIMARDIRTAGDSFILLNAPCLDTAHTFDPTAWNCAAVLDPHPWRITVARNAWVDDATSPDASRFSANDDPPPTARPFAQDPENAVTLRFVPYPTWGNDPKDLDNGRKAVLGRIERVSNPFDFPLGATAQTGSVAVLLDNVVLDDAMRVNPSDPEDIDHRYDYALFMYQLLTHTGEFNGDANLVVRNTTASDWFLTPPLKLFTHAVPAGYPNDVVKAVPYMPSGYSPSGVGLKSANVGVSPIVKTPLPGTSPTTSMAPDEPTSQLRYLLDRNRIRTVRLAFKVAAPRERPEVTDGFDLDGDPGNGTAQLYSFESVIEIKPLSRFLTDS